MALKVPVVRRRGVSAGARRAIAATGANAASLLSYLRAFRTAQRRAQLAQAAGDKAWARKQALSSAGWAIKAASLSTKQIALDRALVSALRKAKVRVTVKRAALAKLVANAKKGSLPSALLKQIKPLKFSTAEKRTLADGLAGLKPADTDALKSLTSPMVEFQVKKIAALLHAVGLGIQQQASAGR